MPTKEELKSLGIRMVVTFLQVALAVVIADGLGVNGADTISTLGVAGMAGVGAVLSVLYNYMTKLGSRLEG